MAQNPFGLCFLLSFSHISPISSLIIAATTAWEGGGERMRDAVMRRSHPRSQSQGGKLFRLQVFTCLLWFRTLNSPQWFLVAPGSSRTHGSVWEKWKNGPVSPQPSPQSPCIARRLISSLRVHVSVMGCHLALPLGVRPFSGSLWCSL